MIRQVPNKPPGYRHLEEKMKVNSQISTQAVYCKHPPV